ncbi:MULTISPECIES: hypothetical protein [unclassified Wolbachia]|uniref:hypothetical protein n=1 Tax=unclassified Wolbachia TaxID=2640676 RepID=UPI0022278540|nr:hypothetical protein [Wolbachia endosymbiont (group B) of Euphydryas aurinia]
MYDIDDYINNLAKCENREAKNFVKCKTECTRDYVYNHNLKKELEGCLKRCDVALKNSDCIKVSRHHDCHRWCEDNYQGLISRPVCKAKCDKLYASFGDTKNTSEDIGDDFYILADSVSVL